MILYGSIFKQFLAERGDSRGPPTSRGGQPLPRGPTKPVETRAPPPERERKDRERDDRDEIIRMPKAKDDQAPVCI